jgi:hypothetical protein
MGESTGMDSFGGSNAESVFAGVIEAAEGGASREALRPDPSVVARHCSIPIALGLGPGLGPAGGVRGGRRRDCESREMFSRNSSRRKPDRSLVSGGGGSAKNFG